MKFPTEHIAGDTLDMSPNGAGAIAVPDYPASSGWTLKYRLAPLFTTPTQAPIDIIATTSANGVDYNVQVAPATTAAWAPGEYTWSRWVEKTGAVQTLDKEQPLRVIANPRTMAQGYDSRSEARKALASLETAYQALCANPLMKSYSIGGRTYMRAELPQIIMLLERARNQVANEDAAALIATGAPNPRNIGVRFNRV